MICFQHVSRVCRSYSGRSAYERLHIERFCKGAQSGCQSKGINEEIAIFLEDRMGTRYAKCSTLDVFHYGKSICLYVFFMEIRVFNKYMCFNTQIRVLVPIFVLLVEHIQR